MKFSPSAFRLAACTVTLACLCAAASVSRADSEGVLNVTNGSSSVTNAYTGSNSVRSGTLTLNPANPHLGATSTTLTLGTTGSGSTTSINLGGNSFTLQTGGTLVFAGSIHPGLFGRLEDLNLKQTTKGATRVKASVLLDNTSTAALHNVTATVYLSDDKTLSADDTTVVTLHLSDYVAKGKVGKHKVVSLPFNYKVPSLVASYLNGKYLIVVLSADDLGSLTTDPIVVGPIALP